MPGFVMQLVRVQVFELITGFTLTTRVTKHGPLGEPPPDASAAALHLSSTARALT